MAFLSADEMRSIRLRGSIQVSIEGISKSIRVVKMSAARQLEMVVKQGKLKATATASDGMDPAGQRDLFLWMMESACTDDLGNPFTKEDASQLFELLQLGEITDLVEKISATIASKVAPGNSKASPDAA